MAELSFTVQELELPGVLLLTPSIHEDFRGFSLQTYQPKEFATFGIDVTFVQDFTSYSKHTVIRGFHFQRAPHEQAKLVRCSQGEIYDVVADCDVTSKTYGTHVPVSLKALEQKILFIPGKYAHAFCVVSDGAMVEYKLSDVYHPELAGGARFNDPLLGVVWPVAEPIVSEKDASWENLKHE